MPDIREINLLSITIRIAMALVIGGLLGFGRGRKNRPAGFRTYMLVCVGSALVMMTNMYVVQNYGVSDPVRMGAQVVSGIGFLGAGTIIVTGRNQIKGITTAAGLWTAACSGLAIGIGFYEGAIIGGIAIFLVMTVMQRLDNYIHSRSRSMDMYVEMDSAVPFSVFIDYARSNGLDIHDMQMNAAAYKGDDIYSVVFSANYGTHLNHTEILSMLSNADGVKFIEEL